MQANESKPSGGHRPKVNPRLIVVVVVLVIAGTLLYQWVQDQRALAAPPEGSGTVEATEVEVGPQVSGRILQLFVQEGDELKPGQVIARLDDVELRAALQQAVGQRDAALNNLRNLQQGSRTQQIAAARATLAQAEAAYRGAVQNLGNAELGFRHATDVRQQVDAAAAQVRSLQAQLASAQRQAAAAAANAAGAERTAATAQENLATVTDLRQQADTAKGGLETATAARTRAVSALQTSQADFERVSTLYSQGALAKRDYDNARLALDTAKTGLDTATAQVATAQATLSNATRALNDRLQARQGVITAETSQRATARQRDAAEAQVQQVEANLAGARLALVNAQTAYADRLQARTTRDTAATATETARHQAEAARQNLDLLLAGNTQASIQAARGQYEAAAGAVAQARKRLQEAVVRAPSAGTVSTVVLHPGDVVSAGLPVVKMLDLQNAYVRVYLPFRSFGKVRVGQAATVDTDALPGATFGGKVIEVASEAEFTPKNVETRDQRLQQVYWVKVGLTNPDRKLKPGMPARATIQAG